MRLIGRALRFESWFLRRASGTSALGRCDLTGIVVVRSPRRWIGKGGVVGAVTRRLFLRGRWFTMRRRPAGTARRYIFWRCWRSRVRGNQPRSAGYARRSAVEATVVPRTAMGATIMRRPRQGQRLIGRVGTTKEGMRMLTRCGSRAKLLPPTWRLREYPIRNSIIPVAVPASLRDSGHRPSGSAPRRVARSYTPITASRRSAVTTTWFGVLAGFNGKSKALDPPRPSGERASSAGAWT